MDLLKELLDEMQKALRLDAKELDNYADRLEEHNAGTAGEEIKTLRLRATILTDVAKSMSRLTTKRAEISVQVEGADSFHTAQQQIASTLTSHVRPSSTARDRLRKKR